MPRTARSICLSCFLATSAGAAADGTQGDISFAVPGSSSTVRPAATAFQRWVRYPAETRQWRAMTDTTAYFRDVFVGGVTNISGAQDGETWHATGTKPDGGSITWPTIRYYRVYTQPTTTHFNCFVNTQSSQILACNTTSLEMTWYISPRQDSSGVPRQRCLAGSWSMAFHRNGTAFHSGQFITLPRVDPARFPATVPSQNHSLYASQTYDRVCLWYLLPFVDPIRSACFPPYDQPTCFPNPSDPFAMPTCTTGVALTIGTEGCYLFAATDLVNYHGLVMDPLGVNDWLSNNSGYSAGGSLQYLSIRDYAQSQGLMLEYVDHIEDNSNRRALLREAICQYGPQVINVRMTIQGQVTGHRLLATGFTPDEQSIKVRDPWDGVARDWDTSLYGADFIDAYIFKGPDHTFTHQNGIQITFHSPGELLLTDPRGRRVGIDPIGGASYLEIPRASYSKDVIGPAGNVPALAAEHLLVPDALVGDYDLRVTGTGTGLYTLSISTRDPALGSGMTSIANHPISPGEIHSYAFSNEGGGTGPVLAGLFDGKGQRPVDVNAFLTYLSPTQVTTTIPAGELPFAKLTVLYARTITSGTFSAQLNGTDVSSQFSPVPGTSQSIRLALQPGRNVLKLSVSGKVGSRTGTDTDRLVFIGP